MYNYISIYLFILCFIYNTTYAAEGTKIPEIFDQYYKSQCNMHVLEKNKSIIVSTFYMYNRNYFNQDEKNVLKTINQIINNCRYSIIIVHHFSHQQLKGGMENIYNIYNKHVDIFNKYLKSKSYVTSAFKHMSCIKNKLLYSESNKNGIIGNQRMDIYLTKNIMPESINLC